MADDPAALTDEELAEIEWVFPPREVGTGIGFYGVRTIDAEAHRRAVANISRLIAALRASRAENETAVHRYNDLVEINANLMADLQASRAEVERLREQSDGLYQAVMLTGNALAKREARVAELEPLADFARLLGPARMVLDRCALNGGDQERQDAADMAQRIVDLIGHPVTDEPPHALVERDELRAEVARLRAERDERARVIHQAFRVDL